MGNAMSLAVETWPENTPEGAVSRYLAAADARRWDEAAMWIDPVEGGAFAERRRSSFLDYEESVRARQGEDGATSAADPARDQPEFWLFWCPPSHPPDPLEIFAGLPTIDALREASVDVLIRSILEAGDADYQARLMFSPFGAGGAARTEANEPGWRRAIGHVPSGPGRAVVVWRAKGRYRGREYEGKPQVIEVTLGGGGRWGLPLQHRLTGDTRARDFLRLHNEDIALWLRE